HPVQPAGDRLVATGPVTDGEVDGDPLIAGEREREQAAQPGPGVASLALDALDHLFGGGPLPGVQHLVEQRAAVAEVPVEAAPGDAERPGQRLDPDRVGPARRQGPQPLSDPGTARRADRGGHRLSSSRLTPPPAVPSLHPYSTVWMEADHAAPGHRAHLPALADPRAHRRFPA